MVLKSLDDPNQYLRFIPGSFKICRNICLHYLFLKPFVKKESRITGNALK